jgi:hypothetical protein
MTTVLRHETLPKSHLIVAEQKQEGKRNLPLTGHCQAVENVRKRTNLVSPCSIADKLWKASGWINTDLLAIEKNTCMGCSPLQRRSNLDKNNGRSLQRPRT